MLKIYSGRWENGESHLKRAYEKCPANRELIATIHSAVTEAIIF